jgi:hypothetical protein
MTGTQPLLFQCFINYGAVKGIAVYMTRTDDENSH